jgi:hypothetical protein
MMRLVAAQIEKIGAGDCAKRAAFCRVYKNGPIRRFADHFRRPNHVPG